MLTSKTSGALVLVSKQNGIVVIPAATPLTRLNYFDGKFLRASDLQAEQSYLRQLVRQSNQAGGAGVAHGFDLTLGGGDTLLIGPGLAIDPDGRVLLLPQETSVGVQELIDKSRDLQTRFGKSNVLRTGVFETCELASETPPANTPQSSNLFLIVISPAEALCGEEDVFGKLCEEACATSTDRPFVVEGLIVRAIPLVLQTPLPSSKAVSLSQAHLRSRVASAYFEDERRRVASLISKFGLEQETWCLGADAAGGSGVPIGVIARAGATTVFLDAWIARRERIDPNPRRYWQWRMMMRPWDVFLAQILQFQCQLRDLFRKVTAPGDVDPCNGAREALNDAAATITELKRFYESTTERFTALRVNLDEALTFRGGLSRLTTLNTKLSTVGQALGITQQDRLLIRGGIVELPSAGYLPVIPGAAITINQQVRRMLGEGVDLRFCVVRPDYVAHALEAAQHMERISLLQGLDDPKQMPQVDILVPHGEILEQKRLSPGRGFEASVDVSRGILSAKEVNAVSRLANESVNFRGAARLETLPSDGGAVYLSCEFEINRVGIANIRDAGSTFVGVSAPRSTLAVNAAVVSNPRAGLWTSLRCERNVFELTRGDTTNFNARAIVASSLAKTPLLDVELNGVLLVTDAARTTGTTRTVKAHIENAQLAFAGLTFGNEGPRKTILVDLDATINSAGGSAIQILLDHKDSQVELSANWDKQPLEVKAAIISKTKNAAGQPQEVQLAKAALKEKPDVLSARDANHIQALAALEVVAAALSDATFADAKARLLFPAPPPPTDEIIVRGTMDWVLFHRRRTKQCSESAIVPAPQVPPRRYEVFLLRAENLDDASSLRAALQAGQIPANRLARVDVVDFGGGVATLLTQTDDLLKDWQVVKPGNLIIFGAIANREAAAADGEPLARTRLDRLEDALTPVSKLHPQAQDDLLTKVPEGTAVSGVDGAIFLITITQVEKTCHSVFRVAAELFPAVLRTAQLGDVASAIGQFGAQLIGEVNFKNGTNDVSGNGLQTASQKWKDLGGGQPERIATVTSAANQTVPQSLALTQSAVIGKGLGDAGAAGPTPIAINSPNAFPGSINCPVITFVAPKVAPPIVRTAVIIHAGLDGPEHFPSTTSKRATVEFDDNVPRGDVLVSLVKSLTPNEPVNGVMLSSIVAAEPGDSARAAAVAKTVEQVKSVPAGTVKSRTGALTEGEKQRLARSGVSLAGIDDVIFLEPNPPR